MILSASRRTDIPAFFADWFYERVKAGFFCVRNPMSAHQVSRVPISPEVIDCIVFWSKNPAPMLPRLDEIANYDCYFQVSITGLGKDIEPHVPDKRKFVLPTFQELSRRLGKKRVIWRYDPIMFNVAYTPEYHLRAFKTIAETLQGYTEKSVVSFVDTYAKNRKNMEAAHSYDMMPNELRSFAKSLSEIAHSHGMAIASCAEKIDLADCGIEHNSCIDKSLIERLIGCSLKVKKDKAQRPECGCYDSIEMGTYNTCRHGCTYCYANYNPASVIANCAKYDVHSPMLCDSALPNDRVTERKVKSLKDPTMLLNAMLHQ